MLDVAGPAQQLHEVLVVGDDQQLEVPLSGAALDDPGRGSESGSAVRSTRDGPKARARLGRYSLHKRVCQGHDVVPVQVGGGLVQGQNPAVQAEGLGQSQADDEGGQHLQEHARISQRLRRPEPRRPGTFCPALQRPLMSRAVSPFTMTTL